MQSLWLRAETTRLLAALHAAGLRVLVLKGVALASWLYPAAHLRDCGDLDLLLAEVEIRVKKSVRRSGKVQEMGELAIQFGSLDALNGLIDRLRG